MKIKLSKWNKISALLALLMIGGVGLGLSLQNHNTKEIILQKFIHIL